MILTCAALWLIAFGKKAGAWLPAILMALAPHLIGAPQPQELTGPTPPELAARTLLGLLTASL